MKLVWFRMAITFGIRQNERQTAPLRGFTKIRSLILLLASPFKHPTRGLLWQQLVVERVTCLKQGIRGSRRSSMKTSKAVFLADGYGNLSIPLCHSVHGRRRTRVNLHSLFTWFYAMRSEESIACMTSGRKPKLNRRKLGTSRL
jgi:hypothetical protein